MIHATVPDLMDDLEQPAFRSLGSLYGGVKQRWVVVYSPKAYQACAENRQQTQPQAKQRRIQSL